MAQQTNNGNESTEELQTVHVPGVILHKTKGPIDVGPVGSSFPGIFPFYFIEKAFGIRVTETEGGKRRIMEEEGENNNKDDNMDQKFGDALLSKTRKLFRQRGIEQELDYFLESGVSNPNAAKQGPRRMHWVGLEILPNQSLALHSHPNIEFVYIVEGVLHEWRMDPTIGEKKIVYEPETVVNDTTEEKYSKHVGPNLSKVDASQEGSFQHNVLREGDVFINSIGDVHQSFTKDEGVKLCVMWGDGNADVPAAELPQNAGFLNSQSAQAWD